MKDSALETNGVSHRRRGAAAPAQAVVNDAETQVCIHEAFEKQAHGNPERQALIQERTIWSYGDLNKRANRIARRLRSAGVKGEMRVAIPARRSPETIAGMLAILKVGGVYVPLDPNYPAERQRLLRQEASLSFLLAAESQGEALAALELPLIPLDGEEDGNVSSSENLNLPLQAENLAYVMFTSGSTGRPKGVEVPHRAVLRLVCKSNYISIEPEQRMLHLAPLAFDASTFEIWGALLNGAGLVLMPPHSPSLTEIARVIQEQRITTMWLTASLFNAVVDECLPAMKSLRFLLAGGDVLSAAHVRKAARALPDCRIINGYGPTENTTFTCCHPVGDEDGASIPIGSAVSGTSVYILDEFQQPVPTGDIGELFTGGSGLARAYSGRPALTAASFLPDPFSGTPGARMYRSGDLVRRRNKGPIEFHGRKDQQVKIRGYRIEPAEVEAVLREHPALRDCAVTAPAIDGRPRTLVAYFCPDSAGDEPDVESLRAHLARHLPAFMLPAHFVALSALPRTANGKLDRAALPAPVIADSDDEGAADLPASAAHELLSAYWRELTGARRVGIHDSFFALGGHSLLATQLVSRIRQDFHVELPVRAVFEAPTIAELARRIENAEALPQTPELPPIKAQERQGELPLSFAQQRLWFLDQLEGPGATYTIAGALRLRGPLQIDALESALQALQSRHEILRTTFVKSAGKAIQRIHRQAALQLELIDLDNRQHADPDEALGLQLQKELRVSFDLARGPLIRARLLRCAAEDHILFISQHHIISDGWSVSILLRELSELYSAFIAGRASNLPVLKVQYADYALWQRDNFSGALLQSQLDYWREHLAGAPPLLALPTDRPRSALQSFDGDTFYFSLDRSLQQSLDELSSQNGVSMFMTLLAAFGVLLARYSGMQDFVIGTPIANRNRSETEGMIGFFANTLALRLVLDGNPTFTELLRRVQGVALDAYAHQDLPFEQLVEQLKPERNLAHSPLFQVMFALQNAPEESLALPDIEVSTVELPGAVAKFDLTLSMAESEDGLHAMFEYNTGLFDATTIETMAQRLQTLLQALGDDPDQRIFDVAFISPAEQALLASVNRTAAAFPDQHCFHELFEARVRKQPEAIAIVSDEAEISYAELDRQADQIANALLRLGCGLEVAVGLLLQRGPQAIAALLGIMKAGAVYVPLDPAYPAKRLATMLEVSNAGLIVTTRELLDRLPEGSASILLLDDAAALSDDDEPRPRPNVRPDNLAYMIFTSGSTGLPKGVMLQHRGLCNLVAAEGRAFGDGPGDRVLQFASLNFDASIWEICTTLGSGATLYMASPAALLPGPALLDYLRRNAITHLTLTPSALAALPEDDLPDLALLVVGGEPCPLNLVQRWSSKRQFYNAYGPTEVTVDATTGSCGPDDDKALIGLPIPNTYVYIVDRNLELLPPGLPGELLIGGPGLARAYAGRPGATAASFIPNPFDGRAGDRLYRSGDLVRMLPDGRLDFLGRIDQQLKIRGYRIEPAEIEHLLLQHEDIRAAHVSSREDRSGNRQLLAWYVAVAESTLTSAALREYLKSELPEFAVPAALIPLAELPLTGSGKVDLAALPDPRGRLARAPGPDQQPANELEEILAAVWSETLELEQVGLDDNFFDLGGHSLLLVQVHSSLSEEYQLDVRIVDLFQYPTVRSLAAHLGRRRAEEGQGRPVRTVSPGAPQRDTSIAIVGMSCRMPGARTVADFWRNLANGLESVSFFSDEELLATGVDPAILAEANYVKAKACLEDIDRFDAAFFGLTPLEARLMAPQHRLFIECVWEALESAGYPPETHDKRVGLFGGTGANSYNLYNLYSNPELVASVGHLQLSIGNASDFLTTFVSYKLNLRGPSLSVQTACSTSLVATHLACRSLLEGESDIALAGGATIHVPHKNGYLYQEGMIYSPDGHCRAFDAEAGGTVAGDGVGIVALKRLQDAIDDGDTIYAVIKGSAINNDGAAKVGFTAPGVDGQSAVIRAALEDAGVEADGIDYVETHGTGTPLGDPIEFAALQQSLGADAGRSHACALGSVKTNIGHTDTAAGVAGLIKTAQALHHRQIPPSLHFSRPNPQIDLSNGAFYFNTRLQDWENQGRPRRAGVSSFGIGGTNAHVVLEEAPDREHEASRRGEHLLVLSAKSEAALKEARSNLADYIEGHPDVDLADLAWTLAVGRRRYAHRCAFVCKTASQALEILRDPVSPLLLASVNEQSARPVVMMCSGQGAQHRGMAAELYESISSFKDDIDECAAILTEFLGEDIRPLMFGEIFEENSLNDLTATAYAQPALFVLEWALARYWMRLGLQAETLIGHSIGELAAACLGGVMSLSDALRLVTARGRHMQSMPSGAMLSVALSEAELVDCLPRTLSIAAINTPGLAVVSGPTAEVEKFEARLSKRDVDCRRLHTSHAFHSPMMEEAAAAFGAEFASVTLHAPSIPIIANLTGERLSDDQARDPSYWIEHIRRPVRFSAGLSTIFEQSNAILLEVGPGRSLASLALRHEDRPAGVTVLSSLPHAQDGQSAGSFFLTSLGRLWLAGGDIVWSELYAGEQRRRLPLPTYPFQRRSYWVDPPARPANGLAIGDGNGAVHSPRAAHPQRRPFDEWFATPSWKRRPLPPQSDATPETGPLLLLIDGSETVQPLVAHLRAAGRRLILVRAGEGYRQLAADEFQVHPGRAADFDQLCRTLTEPPAHILHTWLLQAADPRAENPAPDLRDRAFYSLIFLAQAIDKCAWQGPMRLLVLSSGMQAVLGDEALETAKALALGPVKVIPQEMPQISTASIDITLPIASDICRLLDAELSADDAERCLAYRGAYRWQWTFEALPLAAKAGLREKGVYLITGGLGGIGLSIAERLAHDYRARLILLSRSALPPREQWPDVLSEPSANERLRTKIERVIAMEEAGAEVMIAQADVSDVKALREVIAAAEERFGALHGLIHSAGLPGGGLLQLKTRDIAAQVLAPKVEGSLALRDALRDRQLDFVALCSSLASVYGGFGQVDYVAANAFQDALAQARAYGEQTATLAINWDTWKDEGMAVNTMMPGELDELRRERLERGIASDEGAEAFLRALGAGTAQVLVATSDIAEEMRRAASRLDGDELIPERSVFAAETNERPDLGTVYVEPATDSQRAIASIWQNLLGIEGIGLHDSFFELGGHSLLATRVIAHVRDKLGVDIPISRLFEAPTVGGLAEQVDALALTMDFERVTAGDSLHEDLEEGEI